MNFFLLKDDEWQHGIIYRLSFFFSLLSFQQLSTVTIATAKSRQEQPLNVFYQLNKGVLLYFLIYYLSYYLGINLYMRKIVFCVYKCGIESFLLLSLRKTTPTTNAIINLVKQRWLIILNFFFFLLTVSYVKLANDQRCHQDGRQTIWKSYFWKQQTDPGSLYW